MSMCYWLCQGIGIKTDDIYPYIDREKCARIIQRELPDEKIEVETYELEEFFYGEPFENLGDLLCHCDDTNTLTFGDNGYDESYFYYQPSYPWSRVDNEPVSRIEVCERIVDAVLQICSVSRKKIEELIDDIYEVGCG